MNLVTGATGLLGSHIAANLRKAGQGVRALVRKSADTKFLQEIGVELAYGDITDRASIDAAMKGVRTVYHAAARVGDWGPWREFVEITIDATRNMVESAVAAKVERFLHVSSISAYGHPNQAGLVLDESAPLGQHLYRWSYYSRAKVEAEKILWEASARKRLAVTVIRPSWLYGERDRASMPRLIQAVRTGKIKLIGDGSNRLNLTYAGNEADGIILAASSPQAIGQAYNLCHDGSITLAEYLNRIAAAVGAKPVTKKVPYNVAYAAAFLFECVGHLLHQKKPPLVTRYSLWLMGRKVFFSSEKICRDLGYAPAVGYDEGIARSVKWALENTDAGR